VDPSSSPYIGELVGINAVRDGTILSGQDVVLKIATSGETNLFVMFNRQIGANSGVPGDGDKVLITSQSSSSSTSSWEAALSSGETHTVSGWSDKGTLNIKVCSIDLSSPGKAHILVYANGQSVITCDGTQAPTPSPVLNPSRKPSSNSMCQDTWLPFLVNGQSRNCVWVNGKNVEMRCGKPDVTDLCPLTCGEDCTPFDTVGSFDHNGRDRDCAYVASRASNRCSNNNLRSHCPVTCAGYSYD